MAELKELSPGDKAKRYSKWYYEPIASPMPAYWNS